MTNRKSQPNLNLSGFSPLSLKTKSPSSITSPGKDYGISQRIEDIREKLIAGYDRWQLARSNGAQIVEAIHNAKEKARTSGSSAYPPELENYCSKLKVARTVMSEVKLDTDNFLKEIKRSISIIKSTNDNDELEAKLLEVAEVISRVSDSYESELKVKSQVLEHIAHTLSSDESQVLVVSWSYTIDNLLDLTFLQLKTSPPNEQWTCHSAISKAREHRS